MATSTGNKQHVLIGGGTGFIGQELTRALRQRGDRVTLISRSPGRERITWEDVRLHGISDADVVVNLAGQHILDLRHRWTEAYKAELINSRVETTGLLVHAMRANPPKLFISTSGKCFYGTQSLGVSDTYPELDEYAAPMGRDFPSDLVQRWEQAAVEVDRDQTRHVMLRIGIVLAAATNTAGSPKPKSPTCASRPFSRGVFPLLTRLFAAGLGARFGHGAQPFPWVHLDDVVRLMLRAIDDQHMHGRYNAVSPGIVDNDTFTRALARKLGRSRPLTIPPWLVRQVVGDERASILLQGQKVIPKRTLASGFLFRFASLESALERLVDVDIRGEAA